jgi:hypothetical protein
MRNRYPGRALRAQAGVKVLGLELRDAEYGCLWSVGFLFVVAISSAVQRALVLPSWSIRSLSSGRGTRGEVNKEPRTVKGEPLNPKP